MAFLLKELMEILNRPTVGSVLVELVSSLRPILVAGLVGLLVGWVWKPLKWPLSLGGEIPEDSDPPPNSTPSLPSERFNFGSLASGSFPSLNSLKVQLQSFISFAGVSEEKDGLSEGNGVSQVRKEKGDVSAEDFDYLCQLVEVRDGGPIWIQMMDRSTASMSYQAWRRDPQSGPPQYRSRTVFEDAAPELVRDFFWDDEFRSKWDDMLIYSSTLEDCPTTGTMVVQWVRKFPFFCSDREYIIGRRIWESGGSYYCVTKGVPCTSVPRRNKPRRVDFYYSSWCIRAVESRRGDGQLTSCEVLLFHYEDMGIPWEIAKLGIRQGMWGTVKKIEPGLRAYQMERQTGGPLSRSAIMAQISTKISRDHLRSLETTNHDSSEVEKSTPEKQLGRNIRKFLVIGGAVVVAASLDRGLLTKAVIFGVARKFGKLGRGL